MNDMSFLQEIFAAYMSLCWFISMAVQAVFNPVMPLAIIVPIILAAFPYLIKNERFKNFKKDAPIKRSIALLPAFWVVIGLWGGAFRSRGHSEPWPHFIEYFVLAVLALFLIYGVYRCFKNKGYRILTIILFVINLYFALFVSFCAGMSITGDWL